MSRLTWENWNYTEEPVPYALTATYQIGAEWLESCSLVEDWGCGRGWLRTHIEPGRYRGVDGHPSPMADVVADLTGYRSTVPGIFMRHVLEHNYQWERILDNAVASFTERMALIVFTPFAGETHEIALNEELGVPDISFQLEDLTDRFGTSTFEAKWLLTDAQYGVETVFLLAAT